MWRILRSKFQVVCCNIKMICCWLQSSLDDSLQEIMKKYNFTSSDLDLDYGYDSDPFDVRQRTLPPPYVLVPTINSNWLDSLTVPSYSGHTRSTTSTGC